MTTKIYRLHFRRILFKTTKKTKKIVCTNNVIGFLLRINLKNYNRICQYVANILCNILWLPPQTEKNCNPINPNKHLLTKEEILEKSIE